MYFQQPTEHIASIFPSDDNQSIPNSRQQRVQSNLNEAELMIQMPTTKSEKANVSLLNIGNPFIKMKSIDSIDDQPSNPNRLNGLQQNSICYNFTYGIVFLPWLYRCFGYLGASIIIIVFAIISVLVQILFQEIFIHKKQIRVLSISRRILDSKSVTITLQIVYLFNNTLYSVLILNFVGITTQCLISIYHPDNPFNNNPSFDTQYIYQIAIVSVIAVFTFLLSFISATKIRNIAWANIYTLASFITSIVFLAAYTEFDDLKDTQVPIANTHLQGVVSLSSVVLIYFSQSQREVSRVIHLEYCQKNYVCVYGTLLLTFIYIVFGVLAYITFNNILNQGVETFEYLLFKDTFIPNGMKTVIFTLVLCGAAYQFRLQQAICSNDYTGFFYHHIVQGLPDDKDTKQRQKILIEFLSFTITLILSIVTKDTINVIVALGSTSTAFFFVTLPALLYIIGIKSNEERIVLKYLSFSLLLLGMTFSATLVISSIILIQQIYFRAS